MRDRRDLHVPHLGLRQPRELGVGAQESAQRTGARFDQVQTVLDLRRARDVRHARDHPLDAVRDRLDRRQRIVDLVRQHADDSLPRLLLFFAQRPGEVCEDEQLVWLAIASERRSTQLEPTALGPERTIEQSRCFALETAIEPEIPRMFAEQLWPPACRSAVRRPDSTSTSFSSMSNAKTPTSIAPITLVSSAVDSTASVRWRCSVSPSALISCITRSTALPGRAAGATDRVIAFAQRAEQVRLQIQGACDDLKGHRRCRRPRRPAPPW